jgi:hypothetical protein
MFDGPRMKKPSMQTARNRQKFYQSRVLTRARFSSLCGHTIRHDSIRARIPHRLLFTLRAKKPFASEQTEKPTQHLLMLSGKSIICFGGEDWWYHHPHSKNHLMALMLILLNY